MESYCVFLMGQFIATKRFAHDFGVKSDVTGDWIIEASWQSAFQCSGPIGAFIGVFIAGPITSWIGYRWATIGGLMALNGFIFIFYFGNSQGMFFASQILEGIPWGVFVANAPAYCAEIVPMRLRAPATQMLQMFWAIGSIIVGGITYHYQSRDDPSAYRLVSSRRLVSSTVELTKTTEFQLRCSGCSLLPWLSYFSLRLSRPGGSYERAVWPRQRRR